MEMRRHNVQAAESVKFGMGTVVTHQVYGVQSEEALRSAEAETVRLEKRLSRFLPESDISQINGMAGKGVVTVSSETLEVLARACAYSKCCRGLFDVTIGPLVTLWSVLKRTSDPPLESDIKQLLPLVDYTGLILDDVKKMAGLKGAGQSLDLGGIAKGYAADKIIGIFRKHGIASAYTNFGGNVAVIGQKPDGAPWRVGIQHPRRKDAIIGAVSVENQSVVTSGDYQRCFIGSNGKRYHHILDARTGYPAEKGLISVTVITGSSVAADALSTIVFLLGLEKGIEILKAFPGTEAILIDTDVSVSITGGLAGSFQTAEGYKVNIIDY